MNKNETPMLERFWETIGGTLIEEYQIVSKTSTCERRCIDAVILPNGERGRAKWHEVSLAGQDIVIVQAKASQLGFCLMGQAVFSSMLVERLKPKSLESVALCGADDSNLSPLLEPFRKIRIVIDPLATKGSRPGTSPEKEFGVALVQNRVREYWWKLGKGTLIFNYPLVGRHVAHAIIFLQGNFREADYSERLSLTGEEIIVVTTRDNAGTRPGMCSMGRAYFSAEIARLHKPASLQSVIASKATDSALEPFLNVPPFQYVKVVTV